MKDKLVHAGGYLAAFFMGGAFTSADEHRAVWLLSVALVYCTSMMFTKKMEQ